MRYKLLALTMPVNAAGHGVRPHHSFSAGITSLPKSSRERMVSWWDRDRRSLDTEWD